MRPSRKERQTGKWHLDTIKWYRQNRHYIKIIMKRSKGPFWFASYLYDAKVVCPDGQVLMIGNDYNDWDDAAIAAERAIRVLENGIPVGLY